MGKQNASLKRRRGRRRLNILIAVGTVILVVALAILVDSALYYNKVHAGVEIAGDPGLSLGGLTRDEAQAALTLYVKDAQDNPIVLTSGDQEWSILPSDVGTDINVEKAVVAAMDVTRKSNYFVDLMKRFKLYFSREEITLEGTVDSALLDDVLGEIAEGLDLPPVNAGLTIDGSTVRIVEGQKGNVVDQATLRQELKDLLFTLHATELPVPMMIKEPTVQAEDNAAAKELAETMISAPVLLKSGDQRWTLDPEQIVAYMDFTSEDKDGVSTLVPYISADKMGPFFDEIAPAVAKAPVDATFDSDGNKAWVVPGVLGEALDREATAAAVTAAVLQPSKRTAVVVVSTSQPDFTTEEAEARGIKDKLASYTTEYVGTSNRQNNVRITTKYATNVMLGPGEIYDFEKIVGPRTEARGYKLAPGIVGPGKLEDVFGGGICQVSTTIFNAAFFAGLEIVERHNHSIYIDHYPMGRDATVTVEEKNLRFRNSTDHYIWIRGTSDGITTTVNIYGTSDGRKVTYTTSDFYNVVPRSETTVTNTSLGPGTTLVQISGQSGKQCTVKRTITWPDGTTKQDKFVSTYPMIQKIIEVGTGTTTTTTTHRPTTTTTSNTGNTIVTEF